jgi:hemoglobin
MLTPGLPRENAESPSGSAFGPGNTPYDALGGDQAVRGLVDLFYDTMDRDVRFAAIRSLHKTELTEARQKLYEFLSGWLGGPPLYIQKYGHPKLRARHLPFKINETARDQWLACMTLAMNGREIHGPIREFLDARLSHVADFMRNA